MEKKLDGIIFENAIKTMKKYGPNSAMALNIFHKRNEIRNALLKYYEATEEFENCKFVKDFFESLESTKS